MERIVNMREAKSQLSKLVALAQKGESVTITIRGKPVARLMPIKPVPVFGLGKDRCPPVPWSAFAPMSDEETAEWGLTPVARNTAIEAVRKPIDPTTLLAVTRQMPEQSEDAGAFVRAARDAERY